MTENGMLVEQEKHDLQCQAQKLEKCIVCECESAAQEGFKTKHGFVCDDCERDYCLQQVDCITAYIENNKLDFLLWWLKSLTDTEKADILYDAYKKDKAIANFTGQIKRFDELEKDYCIDSDNFFEFVKEQMI